MLIFFVFKWKRITDERNISTFEFERMKVGHKKKNKVKLVDELDTSSGSSNDYWPWRELVQPTERIVGLLIIERKLLEDKFQKVWIK